MGKKIIYYPFDIEINEYCSRVKSILSQGYEVAPFKYKNSFRYLFKRNDVIIINWFENELLNKSGSLSFKSLIKSTMKFFLFRLSCRKIIYVRHNVYPHNANAKQIGKIKRVTNLICNLSDEVVIHSPLLLEGNEVYIPHPLYEYPLSYNEISQFRKESEQYIIFGRIIRYKKIEEVIERFPKNKKLIIAGSCGDLEYLRELEAMIDGVDNIHIDARYISENEANRLLSSSAGMIISHTDDDMIVSGSFFYAMSRGISIFCTETPFMKWAEEKFGSTLVRNFNDIYGLCEHIKSNIVTHSYDQHIVSKVNESFSDDLIYSIFAKIV